MITYEVPETQLVHFGPEDLPADWQHNPAPFSAKDFGTRLLREANHLVIGVPSAVVPEEFNYILNPGHEEFGQVRIADVQAFDFDARIKT